jgi:hypothetical protein
LFSQILEKFINRSPVTVMTQGLLENLLNKEHLDDWFEKHSGIQYTRDLMFSSVVDIMLSVVCQVRSSVYVAYKNCDHINVSSTSLYNKINGIETHTAAELVRHIGVETETIIKEMKAENPAWIEDYRIKIIDGNCIEATDHRIKPLRNISGAALPGKSLVVFDPQIEIAIDVFPCEDGHAQERSLLNTVLKTVQPKDCWVADRNFCTQSFLFGIHQKEAAFIVREHQGLPVEIVSEPIYIGENETGKVYEQEVRLKSPDDETYLARRISVELHEQTRNGEEKIYILCNLETSILDAIKIVEIYRKRWGIETAFQRLEAHFHSEINSLGYPKAALFGFCLSLVAFNLYAVIAASLRVAHPDKNIKDEVSEYYIAEEIATVYEGMMIAVDSNDWDMFRYANKEQMALLLVFLAKQVNLDKFKKHKRGIKKPKNKKKYDKNHPHISTFKVILAANKSP